MKGWLEKNSAGKKELSLGQVLKHWDRRYCLIDGAILGWHKTEAEAGAVPQGFVEVAECTVTRDTTHQFSVHASDRTLSLRAAAEDEVHRWLVALAGAGCAVGAAARAPLPAEAAVCTALAAQLTMPLAWVAHEGTLRQLWDALRLGHAVTDEETAAVRLPTAAEELRLEHNAQSVVSSRCARCSMAAARSRTRRSARNSGWARGRVRRTRRRRAKTPDRCVRVR